MLSPCRLIITAETGLQDLKIIKEIRLLHHDLVKFILIGATITLTFPLFGQGLINVPPVIADRILKYPDSSTSFVLTTLDFSKFLGQQKSLRYHSSVQIIDANESWPPRWFTLENNLS